MTTAYTSLLGLALPVTGELSGTWGDTVNTAITSLLDTAVAGTTSITTDADITLTTTTGASNQARQAIILWNPASGTVTRNITAPAQSKIYTVINASGGTQSVVIRGAGPTTGVTIAKGESATVAWNGSDFVKVSSSGGAITFTDLTVTGNTILGDAAADTLTVNATSTFNAPVNFAGLVKLPSTGRSAAAALTTTAPAFLYGVASTYTDTTSSGTIAGMAPFYSIAQPTLSTSNVTTYTNAATLYIANGPVAGGSATITNSYAIYAASGSNYLGGGLYIGGITTHNSDVTFQNNANASQTAKLIQSNAFGAAIRFAANGATATDRNLGLGYVNNVGAFTPILTIGDQTAQVATNFSVSADNTYDIGASGTRFKSLYLSGSEYIAGNIYQNASTASAWDSNWQALQGSSGSFSQLSSGQDLRIYMNGAVVGGAEKYVANGYASVQRVSVNGIIWAMYGGQVAGTTFGTPSGQMFFTQNGRLGVGYAVTQTPNSLVSALGGDFSIASTTTSGSTSVGSFSSYSDYSGSNFELTRMQMFTKGAADDGEYKFYTRYGASLVQRLTLGRDGVIGGYFGAGGVTVATCPFQGKEGASTGGDSTGWVFTGNMASGSAYYGNGAGIQLGSVTNNPGTMMGGISAQLVGGGTGGASTDESGGLAFWVKNSASTTITKAMWLLNGSRLGIGSQPYAGTVPDLGVGVYGGVTGPSDGNVYFSANLYNDGAFKAKTSNFGTLYQQYVGDGQHSWWSTTTAPAANATASTLQRNMVLNRNGVLQVGYTGTAVSGNSVIEAVSSSTNAAITAIQATSQFQLQSNGQDGYLNMSGTGNTYFRFGSGANVKATLSSGGDLSLNRSIYPGANTTLSVSTVGWSAGNWYTVAAPGTFSNGNTFWVVYRWDHDGGGGPYIMAGAFMWTVVNTNGGGTDNTFTPLGSSHTGGGYMSFRSRAGSSSSTGLEVSSSAINSGTLVVRFFQFHQFT